MNQEDQPKLNRLEPGRPLEARARPPAQAPSRAPADAPSPDAPAGNSAPADAPPPAFSVMDSPDEYRKFIDNLPIGVYKTHVSGKILYANDALAKIFGFERIQDLLAENIAHHYADPKDREVLIEILKKSGRIAGYDVEIITRNGDQKHVLVNASLEGDVLSGMIIDVSKRKRAEDQLRRSEERFRSLINAAASLIIVLSPEGLVLEFNPEAERILRKKRSHVIGKNFFDVFFSGLQREHVESQFQKVLAGDPVRGLEAEIPGREGRDYVLSWNIHRIVNAMGEVSGLIGVGQDISDRKQVEEELSALLGISQKIVSTIDRKRLLEIAVKKAIEVTDLDRVSVILIDNMGGGHISAEAVREGEKPTPLASLAVADYEKMLEAIEKRKTVHIGDTADPGILTRAEMNLAKMHNIAAGICVPLVARSRVIGVMNFGVTDKARRFTDRKIKFCETIANQLSAMIANAELFEETKRAEEALRESEKRYRTLFNDAPIALWEEDHSQVRKYFEGLRLRGVVDFEKYLEDHPDEVLHLISLRNVVGTNKAALAMLKADNKDQILESQNRIFTKDTYEVLRKWLLNIAQGRTEFEAETNTQTMAGDIIHVALKSSVAPGYDYTREKVLVSLMDITERMKMEEELLKVRKLESVGVLAGGIAHDFNNLLTAVLGNINLARIQAGPDDPLVDRLEEAEKATVRAKDLTQQLLTFSRGGVPIRKTTSLADLIKDAARFSLRGSNVRCEFKLSANLWPADIDAVQIEQVISNMVINADQAMPDGGVVTLRAENVVLARNEIRTLERGRYIRISVTDSGIGMSQEHLQKVFDPYFTTKQKGSGLGLATAYSVVKKHDGHITAESKLGVGTTFHIYLPASDKEVVSVVSKGEEIFKGSGRVLVMDDEEVVREVAGEMLNQIGYEAVMAENGDEAVELYKENLNNGSPFDVIIMDLTVPGFMGGRETIEKLLEIDPAVKSIVSSGYSNDPIMANYRKYGFMEVIKKPYTVKELSEVLHHVLVRPAENG